MTRLRISVRRSERGSALVYILIAIALLAALTIAFMDNSGNQTQNQNAYKLISEVQSQVDFIRASIQECVLTYPAGDSGTLSPVVVQKNNPYPLLPNDTYFAGCGTQGAAADDYVRHLRCPGNPGDNPCHVDVFSSASGKFLPPPPPLFSEWRYYAGDDGIFFWIASDKTDAYIQTTIDKLNASFSVCEADKIDATAGDEDMDSDSPDVAVCPNGSTCFRVWMKINGLPGVPKYPDEPGCP